jgi:hypothetical protein
VRASGSHGADEGSAGPAKFLAGQNIAFPAAVTDQARGWARTFFGELATKPSPERLSIAQHMGLTRFRPEPLGAEL